MAPTNILRNRPAPQGRGGLRSASRQPRREILIRAGRAAIRARLLDTPTADRIWATLPIYSTAETWGETLHFETPVETGREGLAKATMKPGDIAFWVEEDRIIIGWGPSPISKPGEIRLPAPCNVFAVALDDVAQLDAITPGERVAVLLAES